MKYRNCTNWICGALVLGGAMLMNTAPVMGQAYGYPSAGNYAPAGQIDTLVTRIALYPDPLLAQILAAAAFPDQIAAAAQGSGGPFDPSVEALMQYPTVLQMMASDPGWTQALGQAVMQDEGAVMDAVQNLRRQAQQYGYLQSGPQMQVVDDGGYIDIRPVGGYMYVRCMTRMSCSRGPARDSSWVERSASAAASVGSAAMTASTGEGMKYL